MTVEPPSAIVPTPATDFASLRGRRVIVGSPAMGFRGDLRADDTVLRGSRTFVPVLTEQDYYRAEIEQLEVFAPLVPIDRVWVEHVLDRPVTTTPPLTLDQPPIRHPVPATTARSLTGLRLIQWVLDGYIRDLRATTEVYLNAAGATCVLVCGEADWYRWALAGTAPLTAEVMAKVLWVE